MSFVIIKIKNSSLGFMHYKTLLVVLPDALQKAVVQHGLTFKRILSKRKSRIVVFNILNLEFTSTFIPKYLLIII